MLNSRDFKTFEEKMIYKKFQKEIKTNRKKFLNNYTQAIEKFIGLLAEETLLKLTDESEKEALKYLNERLDFLITDMLDNLVFKDKYIENSLNLIQTFSESCVKEIKNNYFKELFLGRIKEFVEEQKRELYITPTEVRLIKKTFLYKLENNELGTEQVKNLKEAVSVLNKISENRKKCLEIKEEKINIEIKEIANNFIIDNAITEISYKEIIQIYNYKPFKCIKKKGIKEYEDKWIL